MFQFSWNEDTAKATSKWYLVLVLMVCKFGDLNTLICTQKFPDNLVIQKPLIKLSVSGVHSLLFQVNRYLPLKA